MNNKATLPNLFSLFVNLKAKIGKNTCLLTLGMGPYFGSRQTFKKSFGS